MCISLGSVIRETNLIRSVVITNAAVDGCEGCTVVPPVSESRPMARAARSQVWCRSSLVEQLQSCRSFFGMCRGVRRAVITNLAAACAQTQSTAAVRLLPPERSSVVGVSLSRTRATN